jgi:hypothetical protein
VNARRVAAVFLWWCALWLLWFAYQGEWNPIEWVAAACAATLGSAVAAAVVWRGLLSASVPLGELRGVWKIPLQVVIDFGIITLALARTLAGRRVEGSFVSRGYAAGGDDPASRGRRAFAQVTATYSPNAYVVHIDEELGEALVHDLVVHRPSEEPIA